jgi:hypothetical protein
VSEELVDLLERAARLRARRDELCATLAARAAPSAPRGGRRIPFALVAALGAAGAALGAGLLFTTGSAPGGPAETLRARVVEVRGPAPARAGESCVVALRRSALGATSAQVDCGDLRLYGHASLGGVSCEERRCDDPDPIAVDGDPSFGLDRATGRLEIADGPRWGVTLAIEP